MKTIYILYGENFSSDNSENLIREKIGIYENLEDATRDEVDMCFRNDYINCFIEEETLFEKGDTCF